MESPINYTVLIQVRDLLTVKTFYQQALKLGAPVVDSSFWVEFDVPRVGRVVLQQANSAGHAVPTRHGISWLLPVDNLSARVDELTNIGVAPIRPTTEIPGRETATFSDPEGNLFTFYAVGADAEA